MQIWHDIQDMTYLEWTLIRRSSGTAGSFLKAREKIGDKEYYYKLSNYDTVHGIYGHECVNEILVDRLLSVLDIPHLHYELIHAKVKVNGQLYTTYLCRSQDFKERGDLKTALDVFYDMEALPGESPMAFCERKGFSESIYHMLLIDFLVLNRDRHGANIEVLKNTGKRSVRMAPLFDHGLSLVFHCRNDEELDGIDPYEDKPIQCFVGGYSSFENLQLIPRDYLPQLPVFDVQMYDELYEGMDQIMSQKWIATTWHFLQVRAKIYEDFRNKKC